MVTLPPEWNEFIGLLRSNGVEFIVVGAYALAAHGRPRATQDLDLFVRPSVENAQRLANALAEFGYTSLAAEAPAAFATPSRMASLGVPPMRIDLLNAIDGVSFDEALAGSLTEDAGGVELRFLGLAQLVTNKQASGRTKDLLDIELLREAGLLEDK
jgi:predicted nucleotidyltransferase